MNACWVSQSDSVSSNVEMQSVMRVYLEENNLSRNNVSFKRDIEKIVLLQGSIKIIVKFRTEKLLWALFLSCTKPNAVLWGAQNIAPENDCAAILKEQFESLYFPEM